MHQAPEITRHQEGNETRAKRPEGHDGRDPRAESARRQMSISEQRDEEDGPSSSDPWRPPKDTNRHAWKIFTYGNQFLEIEWIFTCVIVFHLK